MPDIIVLPTYGKILAFSSQKVVFKVQVSPVTMRRLGSTNLIRDICGTRTNEFRKKI